MNFIPAPQLKYNCFYMNIDIRMQKMNLVTTNNFSFGKKKSEWQKQSGEKKIHYVNINRKYRVSHIEVICNMRHLVCMKPHTYAFIRPTTYVMVVTNILLRTRNQIIIPPTCPPHTVDIIIHTYYRENKSGANFYSCC